MTKEERRSTIPGLVADTMQDYIWTQIVESDIPGKHFDFLRKTIDEAVEEGMKVEGKLLQRLMSSLKTAYIHQRT